MNKLSDNLPLDRKKGGKKNIREVDPETYHLLRLEAQRQEQGLELIASENAVSFAVMEAQGSIFTNKYAEGYPAKRFYGGCEYVDGIENLAIDRAKKLFNASFANVQPHSGSQANAAVFMAELSPSESILGMDLSEGGHLTHGSSVNFSGKIFSAHFYATNHDTGYIDYDQVREKAKKHRPKLIIAGASSYPRIIDFAAFREIADEVGAALLVDMAHIAGLVAAGEHPSPLPHAHYVTTTTHKTLRGPRGGMILTNDEQRFKKINSLVFPGIQGGPLMHVIAAKAIAFKLAMEEEFRDYQKKVIENAQFLAESLKNHGFKIISGGTDNHLLLIDLSNKKITGKAYQIALDKALITINKNVIPNDPLSPFVTSGARVGTPTVTTRKMGTEQMKLIAQWMHLVAENPENEDLLQKIRQEVIALTQQFPLYGPSFTEID